MKILVQFEHNLVDAYHDDLLSTETWCLLQGQWLKPSFKNKFNLEIELWLAITQCQISILKNNMLNLI